MLKPAHFLTFGHGKSAGDFVRTCVVHVQQQIDGVQAQARHQDGGDRYHNHWRAIRQAHRQDRTFVFAKESLYAFECNRVDVPGVTGNVCHMLKGGISRCVESVVHAGGQTQGNEGAVF